MSKSPLREERERLVQNILRDNVRIEELGKMYARITKEHVDLTAKNNVRRRRILEIESKIRKDGGIV